MRKSLSTSLLAAYSAMALLLGLVCSSSVYAKAFVYELSPVADVDVSAGIDLDMRCGDENTLRIDADSEDAFEFRNRNGRLIISRRSGSLFSWFDPPGSVVATVVVEALPETFEVSSGVDAYVTDCEVSGGDVYVDVSSGSEVRMVDLAGDLAQLRIDVSSGAEFDMDSRIRIAKLDLDISSGASVDLDEEVVVDELSVDISSGAFADVCGANATVIGKISSGGDLDVGGDAQTQGLELSSGGRVRARC